MKTFRRIITCLLTLILFISLTAGALSFGARHTISNPNRVDSLLQESGVYKGYADHLIDQAADSIAESGDSTNTLLNNKLIQQSAHQALPPQVIQDNAKKVLDSNYAWLEGKTTTPTFQIDLSGAKQNFTDELTKNIQTQLEDLPACTTTQLLQLRQAESIDPLKLTCQPVGFDTQSQILKAAQTATERSEFLQNPSITADSLDLTQASDSTPYYKQSPKAPKLYQLATNMPWMAAALAAICALGIFFLAPRKLAGLRRICWVLLVSGLVIIGASLLIPHGAHSLSNRAFDNTSGELHDSLVLFVNKLATLVTRYDRISGVVYVAVGAISLLGIYVAGSRQKKSVRTVRPSVR